MLNWAQVNGNWELIGWWADQIAIEFPTREDQALAIALQSWPHMAPHVETVRQMVREEAEGWPWVLASLTRQAVKWHS